MFLGGGGCHVNKIIYQKHIKKVIELARAEKNNGKNGDQRTV